MGASQGWAGPWVGTQGTSEPSRAGPGCWDTLPWAAEAPQHRDRAVSAQGWHLHSPGHKRQRPRVTACPQCSGSSPGDTTEDPPSACVPRPPAWAGLGGSLQGWVLSLCHCLQVLGLEVWEQVSAGDPSLGRGGGGRAEAQPVPPGVPIPGCLQRGHTAGRGTSDHPPSLSPRARGWRKTSQTR